MKLIVAEKPSAAMAYSKALNVTARKDGYIEGGEYIITWCLGHLIDVPYPESYDERYERKNFKIDYLPFIPQEWKYEVAADKKKQFKIVKDLMLDKRVDEIICGTDAGREGELIFRLVYNKAGCKKPFRRLWVSSMEDKALKDGFSNLKDGSEYDNLYMSALCRRQADFIIGINATMLFSKLYYKRLNIGRVQTPTLAMLCERLNAIKNFKKEKYFNAHLCFDVDRDGNPVSVEGLLDKIKEQSEAEQIKADCNGQSATVKTVIKEKKTINPPKLFDLTSLQREANRLYGYTAQQTLDCAQALYEMKLVTYPRTDSQYLNESMSQTASDIIGLALKEIPHFEGFTYEPDVARILNDKKVTDHHAIIPTAELENADLETVPEVERKILYLITNKLICATGTKHEYEAVTAEIECNGHIFTAKGKSVITDGWKQAEKLFKEFFKDCKPDDEEKESEKPLYLDEGQVIEEPICNITEHFTSPPKHYNEDTLLSAMERAGADEVTEEVERSGLGTPATRAGIIEKLIKDGYAVREKKNIIATEHGIELIGIAPDELKTPKFTAEWEDGLARMAQGKTSPDSFMEEIGQCIGDIIKTARENVDESKIAHKEREAIGVCPRCGGDVCESDKGFYCVKYKDGCKFTLWKNRSAVPDGKPRSFFESARKPLTKEIAAALLKNGKVKLDGLYSEKKDKTYSATVILDDNGRYTNFKLEFDKK